MQVATTMDYATDSWFWTVMTGALNHQTVHHLFPGVSQYYYGEITPILVRTAKEFGVKYNYKPTFSQVGMVFFGRLLTAGSDGAHQSPLQHGPEAK
jgi:fatty acid desaturase